jgi:SAM-dependent methyltransferase
MIPKMLNLGSGKDYKPEYLNADINTLWRPDMVLDISKPLFAEGVKKVASPKYGEITIEPGMFDRIIANDVLEHLHDLVTGMTNCLQLLAEGGEFHIGVPYELSLNAWRDPTHVRAFNEHSWLYFTDWFWYLGWESHRFVTTKLDFQVNPLGQQLLQKGMGQEELLRTPRTVDAMSVVLKKVALTDQEKALLDQVTRRQREDV